MAPKGGGGSRRLEPSNRPEASTSSTASAPASHSNAPPPTLKFTSFSVIGFLNGKNVSANFVKNDAQSWWSRRSSDQEWDKERDGKRRKLMGSEEELEQAAITSGLSADSPDLQLNVLKTGVATRPEKRVPDEEDEYELASDPMLKTIIIHPGSRWLRIGRASDAFPITMPNVIASKSSSPTLMKKTKTTSPLPPPTLSANLPPLPSATSTVDNDGDAAMDGTIDEDEDVPVVDPLAPVDPVAAKISSIRGDLRARMRIFKLRGQGTGNAQALAFNEQVVAEATPDYNDPHEIIWTDTRVEQKEYYVGAEALAIPDPAAAGYILRRPFDRGAFNTTDYTSSQEFLGDIERIWMSALEGELGITKSELKDYSAILIIPDLYDHIYVREMTDLVLKWCKFKQLCLQQESICATFGAGLSSACVIDIGAKKTSISCIEEGLILPETRMVLDFAGDDITEFLHTLLARNAFPYREANLALWHDFSLMEELKEKMVVLSEADVGLNSYDFYARAPGISTKKYTVRVYDDVILAPYALFAPRVVDFEKKVPPQAHLWSKEVEDIIDIGGNATTNAMRNSTRHLLPPQPALVPPTSMTPLAVDGSAPSVLSTPNPEDAALLATTLPAALTGAGSPAPGARQPTPTPAAPESLIDVRHEASKIPLDVAVVESIIAAGTEDRMKKMCGNILIVGGTGLIHNVGFAVESRVGPALAARVPALSTTTIVPAPRDIDPRILAWKGISVLCKLDSVSDLWIRREDWEALGLRAVKERCFFLS